VQIPSLPALAPSRSIGGRGQISWRRALPPADNNCSAVWMARWRDSCNSEVCRWLEASPRTATSGGRAMDPSQGNTLQHRRHERSLPQHALCMPGCSRRLRLACHMDGLHLCIRRFLHAQSTSAYHLEALNELRTMSCMRACIHVALPARFSRFAPVPNGGPSRSWAQNAHAVHPEGARSVSKRVCSLSCTPVNTFKPLSNARISQISRPFLLPAGSVRPS
jgi:hypothetical protein